MIRFSTQLKAIVRAQYPTGLEVYEESLDLDRFPDAAHRPQVMRYFAAKYEGLAIDAVVAEGSGALAFVVNQLSGLFAHVPVVYGAAFEPILDFSALPANVVGRRQPLPFAATYTLARSLQPDARRVLLVGGESWTDSLLVREAQRQIVPLLKGTTLMVYQGWSYEGLVDSLRRLPSRTAVLLSGFTRDHKGRKFVAGDLIASLTRFATVPVYGITRNWVGDGIVGGGVMDFSEDGARTAAILLRVLARRPGDPMPASEIAVTPTVVDWRQLERWDLSAARLPRNAEIMFRPPSTWERHRTAIVAAGALFIVESALIAMLLAERKRRVRAQRAVDEARAQVERMARVATANELATAVSHQLRQPLTAIRMNAAAGALLLEREPPNLREARLALQDIANEDARAWEVVEHYRGLLRNHEPTMVSVDLNDVCRVTATLVEHEVARRKARLDLDLDPRLPRVLGDGIALQQAIINLTLNALDAVSASPERSASISTTTQDGHVQLSVRDTGPGLSPEAEQRLFEPFFSTKSHGLGMGLAMVRTIVERHHGTLRGENVPDGGAVFTMTLAVEKPAAAPLWAARARVWRRAGSASSTT